MEATSRINETELKEILARHFERRGVRLKSISIKREDYGGDPRERSYGYVEVQLELNLPTR